MFLESILGGACIVHVQEAHGSKACVDKFCNRLKHKFWIYSSFLRNEAGGILTFVSKSWVPSESSLSFEVFVRGRASRLLIHGDLSQHISWNVHNYGIPREMFVRMSESINFDISFVNSCPFSRALFLFGDFNFPANVGQKFNYSKPLHSNSVSNFSNGAATDLLCEEWHTILDTLVELVQPCPTHYWPANHSGSIIDRGFTSIRPCIHPFTKWKASIFEDPCKLHYKGISDHTPFIVEIACRTCIPVKSQPIRGHIFKHPKIQEFHKSLVEDVRLQTLDPRTRLLTHKDVLRQAALLTRRFMQNEEEDHPAVVLGRFGTISRVVWENDSTLANTLIANTTLGKRFLYFSDGVVTLRDPVSFDREFNELRHQHINDRREEIERSQARNTRKSSDLATKLAREAAVVVPISKKLILQGLRVAGNILRDPSDQFQALSEAWAPTFAHRQVDHSNALDFLNSINLPSIDADIGPPAPQDFLEYSSRQRDSGTGPDGLPYSAWTSSGFAGACTLYNYSTLIHHEAPDPHFNASLSHFLPKGDAEGDAEEVIRSALETRLISAKNSDNKTIVGASIFRFKRWAQENTHHVQRGFVPGRNFLNNVVDLDSASRIYSNHAIGRGYGAGNIALIPILALFDFATAFPSVIHDWIFLNLQHRNFPAWFTCLIRSIYKDAAAYCFKNGILSLMFYFYSGVLQGCPASAFLFNIALDPFLTLFHNALREKGSGIVRACADDLGAALQSLKRLMLVFPIFKNAQTLAGLLLKPPKCILIPLVPWSQEVVDKIKNWLGRHIPSWANFNIKPTSKYLGFYMGPQSGTLQWLAPFAKYQDRVNIIYGSGASISLGAYSYNVRTLPVLSYVSQLICLPDLASEWERKALYRVTHFANNSFEHNNFFWLHKYGGPNFRSLIASSRAAMMRTARVTVTGWPSWKEQIIRSAQESLPCALWGSGIFHGNFWDSPPIAMSLSHAFAGFPGDLPWDSGARGAISNLPSQSGSKKDRVQHVCYKHLLEHAYPDNTHNIISRRIHKLFEPFSLDTFDIDFSRLSQILKTLRKHDAIRVLKTWVNSWHTSDRYHESTRLPCVFGCTGALDKLSHYVMCPFLFGLIKQFSPLASPCPVERLGLINTTRENLLCMACTFGGYHAVRRFVASELTRLRVDSDVDLLHPNFACTFTISSDSHSIAVGVRAAFCDAFWADAVDCRFKCAHYHAPENSGQLLALSGQITDTFDATTVAHEPAPFLGPETDVSDTSASGTADPLHAGSSVASSSVQMGYRRRTSRGGITEQGVPSVAAGSASCFVRASDANAHNPFVQPFVQQTLVTPSGVQEIPPTGALGVLGSLPPR